MDQSPRLRSVGRGRRPHAPAIVEYRNSTGQTTRISYRELRDLSIRFAAALAGLGVQRGDVVSIQRPNCWHFAAVHAACVRIGAVTNPLMPIFRERELQFMLGFAGSRVLILPQQYRGCAFVSLRAGASLDFASLIQFLNEAGLIKPYWPERLEVLDAFPRTPSGKIQKFRLREMAATLTPMAIPR
jgi:acyl-coenzyme A synthetase/AMP-(fatty) acid ligase